MAKRFFAIIVAGLIAALSSARAEVIREGDSAYVEADDFVSLLDYYAISRTSFDAVNEQEIADKNELRVDSREPIVLDTTVEFERLKSAPRNLRLRGLLTKPVRFHLHYHLHVKHGFVVSKDKIEYMISRCKRSEATGCSWDFLSGETELLSFETFPAKSVAVEIGEDDSFLLDRLGQFLQGADEEDVPGLFRNDIPVFTHGIITFATAPKVTLPSGDEGKEIVLPETLVTRTRLYLTVLDPDDRKVRIDLLNPNKAPELRIGDCLGARKKPMLRVTVGPEDFRLKIDPDVRDTFSRELFEDILQGILADPETKLTIQEGMAVFESPSEEKPLILPIEAVMEILKPEELLKRFPDLPTRVKMTIPNPKRNQV